MEYTDNNRCTDREDEGVTNATTLLDRISLIESHIESKEKAIQFNHIEGMIMNTEDAISGIEGMLDLVLNSLTEVGYSIPPTLVGELEGIGKRLSELHPCFRQLSNALLDEVESSHRIPKSSPERVWVEKFLDERYMRFEGKDTTFRELEDIIGRNVVVDTEASGTELYDAICSKKRLIFGEALAYLVRLGWYIHNCTHGTIHHLHICNSPSDRENLLGMIKRMRRRWETEDVSCASKGLIYESDDEIAIAYLNTNPTWVAAYFDIVSIEGELSHEMYHFRIAYDHLTAKLGPFKYPPELLATGRAATSLPLAIKNFIKDMSPPYYVTDFPSCLFDRGLFIQRFERKEIDDIFADMGYGRKAGGGRHQYVYGL